MIMSQSGTTYLSMLVNSSKWTSSHCNLFSPWYSWNIAHLLSIVSTQVLVRDRNKNIMAGLNLSMESQPSPSLLFHYKPDSITLCDFFVFFDFLVVGLTTSSESWSSSLLICNIRVKFLKSWQHFIRVDFSNGNWNNLFIFKINFINIYNFS